MTENEKIKVFQDYYRQAKKIVFFGGAGVSTESGIKDFRSKDGIYQEKGNFPPERILSHSFFQLHPYQFFQFYKEKMDSRNASCNETHRKLKEWEKEKDVTIITQNIDGLHQKAGSTMVLELHGSIYQNNCVKCQRTYPCEKVFDCAERIPTCSCGGIIKPSVVLYEEALDEKVVTLAIQKMQEADLLIIAGTSLSVYPACTLIDFFQCEHIVLINQEKTPYDKKADLVFHSRLGRIMNKM